MAVEVLSAAKTMPKLYGECMSCRKAQFKRKMTTIYTRPPGKAYNRPTKTFGFICEKCLPEFFDRYSKGDRNE